MIASVVVSDVGVAKDMQDASIIDVNVRR